MKTIKRFIPVFAAYTGVFLLAEALRFILWGRVFFFLINSLIMSVLILVWTFSDGIYTPDRTSRLLRYKLGAVMVFWAFCKCCHDRFLMESDALCRFSWYAYYVAIIFLPVFCYEFSLHFGAKTGEKYKKRLTVLYAAAVVLILLILTNDLHRLAFGFPCGINEWADEYSRGAVYYIAAAFSVLLILMALFNVFRQCTLPKSKKYIWLPAIPVTLMIVYTVLYLFNLDLRLPNLIDGTTNVRVFAMTDVLCFLLMIFIEACGIVYRIATELPDEQSFIIQKIWAEIEEKSDRASELVNSVEAADGASYRQRLYHAGVIQTFNKRVSNLILLGRQNGKLDFSELVLSFAELVEYLKLNGTDAAIVSEGKGSFTADEMISVYREFENRIEEILPELGALMVVLSTDGRKIRLRILAEDREGGEL